MTSNRFKALQGWVQKHKHIFSDNDYVNIYPSSATIPTLYGQAKIHKDAIPMRPILSMVGAYNHGLATYLGKIFSGLRDSKNICKDSFSLAKFLGQSNLHDAYFVS